MKHVISIENAKKLDELCVKAESEKVWFKPQEARMDRPSDYMEVRYRPYKLRATDKWYPAYSVGELGEMLPPLCGTMFDGTDWCCEDAELATSVYSENEADARAALLIWLIEQGHIKAEDLK